MMFLFNNMFLLTTCQSEMIYWYLTNIGYQIVGGYDQMIEVKTYWFCKKAYSWAFNNYNPPV